jgi:flavin reductase (DIM6/NTAB) family NADH-FMN oxidoreductase RutF
LTVTSFLVASGEEARVVGLLDPDADLTAQLLETARAVVQLLTWGHRDLADVFAGTAPAPGGMFQQGDFEATEWGPRLTTARTWAGVRLESRREVGWSTEVTTVVEHLEVDDGPDEAEPLLHRRGRYSR